jgi:hypothetical protein
MRYIIMLIEKTEYLEKKLEEYSPIEGDKKLLKG